MTTLETTTITIFSAVRDNRPLGFDVDRDRLYRNLNFEPNAHDITVYQRDEVVGVITGELVDWNAGEGGAPRVKLHWICPRCGLEQWEDWSTGSSNPSLCGSNCQCIGKWLVHWPEDEVN